MERNTVTTIGVLNVGDRFHKLGDKKKEVWQKGMHIPGSLTPASRDKDKFPTPFKKDTQVIFLRHAETK